MSKSKSLGTAWESAVVAYLREHGYRNAERRALSGSVDRGDVSGVPAMIECKNEARISLATYADEVKKQTKNANAKVGVAWVKRRGKGVKDSYVVMDPETFLYLLMGEE